MSEDWKTKGGRHIKERRLHLGLTLAQVAEKIGRSVGTVSKYETGALAPLSPDVLPRLAGALRVESASALYLRGEVVEASP